MTVDAIGTTFPASHTDLSGKIHRYLGYIFAALIVGGGVVAPFGFYIFATFIR